MRDINSSGFKLVSIACFSYKTKEPKLYFIGSWAIADNGLRLSQRFNVA
jgi:hypothetical protein